MVMTCVRVCGLLTLAMISSFFFFSTSMESVEWLCTSNVGDVTGLVPEKGKNKSFF